MKDHDFEADADLPDAAADDVVAFPVHPKLTRARQAYRAELERFDRLVCAGKRPRLNKLIVASYFAILAADWFV